MTTRQNDNDDSEYSSTYLTRRRFLTAALGISGSMIAAPPFRGWSQAATAPSSRVIDDSQWGFGDQEKARLAGLLQHKLLDMAVVATLPENAKVRHLGWPVATRLLNGRTIVLFRRASGHTDSDDARLAGHYILYSDNLIEWKPQQPLRLGPVPGMHCIGSVVDADGNERVIAMTSGNPQTLYTSDDHGVTWKADAQALQGILRTAAHIGPNLIQHPDFGLVAAFGQETKGGRRNYLVSSTDAGRHWQECIWLRDVPGRGFEPSVVTWGPGHMIMISRETLADFAIGPNGLWGHSQHVYQHHHASPLSLVNFKTSRTNIVGNPAAGNGCNDTAEVIFNPVSQRIEVLQSHRWGGGLGRTGRTIPKDESLEVSSLNLWSINPDDLLAGSSTWRFDGTIIERTGFSRKGNRDGLHPGGSIVDIDAGMQHIFVYAGWRRSPASIFRISRTLDTDALRRALL